MDVQISSPGAVKQRKSRLKEPLLSLEAVNQLLSNLTKAPDARNSPHKIQSNYHEVSG